MSGFKIESTIFKLISWLVILRGIGSVSGVFSVLVISRLYDLDSVGVFAVYQSCFIAGGQLVRFGAPLYLEKSASRNIKIIDLKRILFRISVLVFLLFSCLVLSSYFAYQYLPDMLGEVALGVLVLGVMVYAISPSVAGLLRGLGFPRLALVVEPQYIVFLSFLFGFCVDVYYGLDQFYVFLLTVYCFAILLLVLLTFLTLTYSFVNRGFADVSETIDDFQFKYSDMVSFWLMGFASLMQNVVPIWICAIFLTSEELGVFRIIISLSALMGFSVLVVNSFIPARLSSAYSKCKFVEFREISILSANFSFLMGFPVVLFVLIFNNAILEFFVGDLSGHGIYLFSLCVAQMINISTGSIGSVLVMSDSFRLARNINIVSTVIASLVYLVAIYFIGLAGAAFSAAVSILLSNLISFYFVKKIFGFLMLPSLKF